MIEVLLDPVADDQARALLQRLYATLGDVRLAVDDYAAMLAMTDRAIGELDARAKDLPAEQLDEYRSFLAWMRDRHFIFLGARVYEYPRTPDGGYAAEEPPTARTEAWASCATSAGTCCAARASRPSWAPSCAASSIATRL